MNDLWNAGLYDDCHGFVHEMAGGLVRLLDLKPGERILDLGCGTGHLTKQIADAGATVVGVDSSPAMVAEAHRLFPELTLQVADATTMTFDQPFDKVFSNAVLHWVRPPEEAVARVFDALVPGGSFVLEMGGSGNVAAVLSAAVRAGESVGFDFEKTAEQNYFPTVGEYSKLLEAGGFEVRLAMLFDRPTPLPGGVRDWLRMFRPAAINQLPVEIGDEFFSAVEQAARPSLFRDGRWLADYRRLRVVAVRTGK